MRSPCSAIGHCEGRLAKDRFDQVLAGRARWFVRQVVLRGSRCGLPVITSRSPGGERRLLYAEPYRLRQRAPFDNLKT